MNEESLFREKARGYVLCYSDQCQLRDRCLRRVLTHYVPDDKRMVTCVNPMSKIVMEGQCDMFVDNQKVRMARGMMTFFDEMPEKKARIVRNALINRYSRKIFYSYRKGERLISPAMQQEIADILQSCDWQKAPVFDSFVVDYCWD